MIELRRVLLALFALSLFAGCHSYAVDDDIQINFDILTEAITGPSDSLHLPYVQGTQVNLFVDGDTSGHAFTIESDDSAVFSVDVPDLAEASAQCTARSPGTAGIHVLKDGQEVYSTEVSVAAPTRAVIWPAGPLFVNEPIPLAANGTTEVVNGGTATYMVQYFDGNTPLFGNGVLSATAPGGLTVTPESTFLFQRREWLEVTASALGPQPIALEAAGISLGTLTVDVVDPSAIASVTVEADDTSNANDGDWHAVLAQSFDASGTPIFGVVYGWDLSGVEQEGEGDLFEYPFDSGQTNVITASFGSLAASVPIEAKQGTGFVGSSNDVGCRAAPGAGGAGFAAMAVALLGLACAARRRRARG